MLYLHTKLDFGKHKGKIVKDLCLSDPAYITWLNKESGYPCDSRVLQYIKDINSLADPDCNALSGIFTRIAKKGHIDEYYQLLIKEYPYFQYRTLLDTWMAYRHLLIVGHKHMAFTEAWYIEGQKIIEIWEDNADYEADITFNDFQNIEHSEILSCSETDYHIDIRDIIPFIADKNLIPGTLYGLNTDFTPITPIVEQSTSSSSITKADLDNNSANSSNKENTKMPVKQTILATALEVNKASLQTAATIELGNVAISTISKKIGGSLPLMLRGYKDHPLFEVLVANIATMAINHFAPENEKGKVISEAMMQAAMLKMVQSFNIPEMVNELIEDIPNKLVGKVDKAKK